MWRILLCGFDPDFVCKLFICLINELAIYLFVVTLEHIYKHIAKSLRLDAFGHCNFVSIDHKSEYPQPYVRE